jgi:hypothetical protein
VLYETSAGGRFSRRAPHFVNLSVVIIQPPSLYPQSDIPKSRSERINLTIHDLLEAQALRVVVSGGYRVWGEIAIGPLFKVTIAEDGSEK